MNSHAQLTRRAFYRICGFLGLLQAIRRQVLSAEPLRWEAQPDRTGALTRTYRADAQIVLLSVPVLRRSGVGAGRVTWSEDEKSRRLDFLGYSFPEHAAGLNRLGFIRELACKDADAVESLYFGVMTASPEDNPAEARKALHEQVSEQLYTAIEGRITSGSVETITSHFTAPARLSVAQHDQLVAMARQALSAAPRKPPEFTPGTAAQPTFLQALAKLLQDPSRNHIRYSYNARLYGLWLRRYPDSKATAYFRGRRLIAQESTVVRVEARVSRETAAKEANFQLWVEQAERPLPLRIEYQPKSYLRLTFEADGAPGVTDIGQAPAV